MCCKVSKASKARNVISGTCATNAKATNHDEPKDASQTPNTCEPATLAIPAAP